MSARTQQATLPSSQDPAKLAEVEKSLLSIRQARDAVIERNKELVTRLTAAEERIAVLEDQCADLHRARDAAERNSEATRTEREELRRNREELRQQVRDLNDQRLQGVEVETRLRAELGAAQEQITALTAERDRQREELAAGHHAGASRELLEAQAKIAELSEQATRQGAEHQKRLTLIAAEVASANRMRDLAVSNVIKAQTQVQSLKVDLDVERKQAKEDRCVLEARILALEVQAGVPITESEAEKRPSSNDAAAPASSSPPPEPVESGPKAFTPAEITEAAASLAAAYGRLAQAPAKDGLLEKLEAALDEFSGRARATKLPAFHRSSVAALELTRWLRKTPAKIPSALSKVQEFISLLTQLAENQASAAKISDVSGATVYAVDDDIDNCECIAMALEKLEFQTKYSVTSKLALTQLKTHAVDLIILDVDLPQMDGFDLYARLRKTATHAETPILFLSALISTQDRLEELPPGNHAFLSKPYNLTVLGAKVTAMILSSRLASATAGAPPR